MKVTIKNPGLPIGLYECTFEGIEETDPPPDHPDYGEGNKWTFECCKGPLKGRQTFRTTT